MRRQRDLSLDLIATANFDGFFTRVNPSWERIFGWSEEEVCARPFIEFVHPDDRDATVAEAVALAEFGEDAINFRNRYQAKDGSYVWLEWMARANKDSKEIFCIGRDITLRKQAEETLQHHTEMLEEAVRQRTNRLQETTQELEHARLETLRCLALAAEYRDDQTSEHTERVGQTAALIAEKLGLPEHEVSLIRLAAPLHDIGKLGVSDLILHKPGKLTADEFRQVHQHAQAGASILSGSTSDVLQLASEIALTHHEWWDGSGYPAGLQGEAIPLSGRIVALADVYDALTHVRPYKRAWTVEQAVAEIHTLSGRQFDPQVVKSFETLDHYQAAGQPHTRRASDRQTKLHAVA